MDSDVEPKVKVDEGQQGEAGDGEMTDAPVQEAHSSQGPPQAAHPSQTGSKTVPPSSDSDLFPPSNLTSTNPTLTTTTNPTNTILETTEKPPEPQKMGPKKKGTAAVKKTPKRPRGGGRGGGASKGGRLKKPAGGGGGASTNHQEELGGGSDEESDNGPYCICRGPDDHRFMISCDVCEDWFHGECIDISKDVGENLIERFVCPNCTDVKRNVVSLFKKTCSYAKCIKAARLYGDGEKSAFCSDEHKQLWWEKAIASLPKKSSAKNTQDGLVQEELMGLLTSNLAGVDPEDGKWRVQTRPFAPPATGPESPESKNKTLAPGILTTEEEVDILKTSAAERYKMGEEVVLCQKMLQLLDWANDRRKSLIASKHFDDAACGYDYRLDQVGVVGPFANWLNSDEAKEVFKAGNLDVGSRLAGDDKNICDKKRCKAHQGWFSIHTRDVRYQMKLLAMDANKKLDKERLIKQSAAERKLRKEAENNYVQAVLCDGTLGPPKSE
ncbi:PHD-finger domain-containing protein [Colletotrichum sublineola]|uniref:Putative PHD-finger domain-containing protein n=1 Tax=Colletotrichum sublineola TaxID=1173701 RepID=A0A066WZE3_COLSU|nr:PHD-finger domain-containing protein [Colletotrichum sublineola]KDN60784.1 putative PHD-finger domain-containing protein [Colletotrichum sublineola]